MKEESRPTIKPTQFRPDEETERQIEELTEKTGLTRSEVVRRACQFAFPKFLTGEEPIVNI